MSKLYFSHFDNQGIELPPNDEGDDAVLDPAPSCFGSHLRKIELFDLLPCKKKVGVVALLLKHAMVLEKFMISRLPLKRRTQEMFRKKLLEVPCGSKNLEIAFSVT